MMNTCKRSGWPSNRGQRLPGPCCPLPSLPESAPCCDPCCEPCRDVCREPCRIPQPSSRCAGPQVVCCGQESQRFHPARLCVTGLPQGLCQPLRLVCVEPGNEEPCIAVKRNCSGPFPMVAEVTVPLVVWVCDARGRKCSGCAKTVICVNIPARCGCDQGIFMASADVRLADPGCPACQPVFDVRLQTRAEVYLVRLEPCGRTCQRECLFPQLPMYPQPCHWGR